MTEPDDRLATAIRRLRAAVHDRITAAPAPAVRARAARRLRVRRTTASLAAAAAVAVVVVGGTQVAGNLAGPLPVEPAGTPSPVPSTGSEPTPAVTPSPRPAPLPPPAPPDDPIVDVDWLHPTITLPPMDGCPSGTVHFEPEIERSTDTRAQVARFPNLAVSATVIAYGDLTGDGAAEAVLQAICYHEHFIDSTFQGVLVVSRESDGTLVGLAYVPVATLVGWIEDGELLVDSPGFGGPPALAYRWDGERFVGGQAAEQYPAIVPEDANGLEAPVRPRAVAAALGCPDEELRFRNVFEEGTGIGARATASGATYLIRTGWAHGNLYDLDNTGQRLFVTPFGCTGPDGQTREGVAVFERAGEGWQGISLLPPPDGYGTATAPRVSWDPFRPGMPPTLVVTWEPVNLDGPSFDVLYRWTGTELVPES